ncbi:MAG: diguanylate cyclase [Thermodesulfobacteriota bacterium]
MKILLVDDTATERMLMATYLKKMGHEVIVGENGEQAVSLYSECQPDLILLDVIMPVMDGHEAARRIRALDDEWIPIIFLSAKTEADDIVAGIQAGGDDYLTKPVDRTVLSAKMHAMQRIAAMRQRLLDVTLELDGANQELQRLVSVDGLTGLANRRYLDQFIEHEMRRLRRSQSPIVLIMADIDNFKAYNDHFGHMGGDDCLRSVASALREELKRPADLVARYGGEEFCVVLPETKLAGGTHVAENLRRAVESRDLPQAPTIAAGRVTLSLGVAGCLADGRCDIKDILNKADQALYQAKQEGRNRVITAG